MSSIIVGDITEVTVRDCHVVICHQTNCVTTHSAGLAKNIFLKYPESDIYSDVNIKRTPGKYIKTLTHDGKTILHLNGQIRQGTPKIDDEISETTESREQLMKEILDAVSLEYKEKKSPDGKEYVFLFPMLMGCVLAGGIWSKYRSMIKDFESKGHKVYIVEHK